MSNKQPLLSIEDVAQWMRVSETGVRRLVERREIRYLRIGRQIRLREEDVLEFMSSRTFEPMNLDEVAA